MRVQASPDGITWTTVGTISFSSTTDSVFRSANYDISAMATSGTQIRFLGSGSDQRGYLFVDNVTVAFDGNVTPPPPDGNAGGAFKMAIPAYFRPGSYWVQLENGIRTVGLAVMNPGNGPGQSADQSYLNDIAIAQGRGTLVLGYVYTGYGQRSSTTVKNDISKYFQWYNVDGIFVDETSDRCSLTPYYQTIFSYVKSLKPSAKVAINPGNVTQECYAAVADIILNFEDI